MHIPLLEAKTFPSYTLFVTICGYLLGISLIPRVISQANALRICTVLGAVFTLAIVYLHGEVRFLGHITDISIWFVVMLGFANSLVVGGHLAVGAGWVGTLPQAGCVCNDYGFMRQCHVAGGIRTGRGYVQCSFGLFGIIPVLPVPDVLRILRV